jgi:predicted tellurium resistance membrane protein TerC
MELLDLLLSPAGLFSLLTLSLLEIVLGIDNVIFVSIILGKLPPEQQPRARRLWIISALLLRFVLLSSITWIAGLTYPLFAVAGHNFSGRDLIMMGGGLFLLAKSTIEIHSKLEGDGHEMETASTAGRAFAAIMAQVILVDLVFSLDSVITAIGLANELPIMIISVVIALMIMLFTAQSISRFIEQHPTLKMLALSFLLMVGLTLFIEGFEIHVPKGYIYTAMAFSILVEMLNMRMRKKNSKPPVHLR